MAEQIVRSTTRVNSLGELEEHAHEEWRKVFGYTARTRTVQYMLNAYRGNLLECQTLHTFIHPITFEPC